MKTRAAVLTAVCHPLELWDLEVPALKPGQVLVEVEYSGICHTQLNEVQGLKGEDRFLPHTLGHEGVGIVREVGTGVTKVAAGDRVILTWLAANGANIPATQYTYQDRVVNSGAISTFMQYAVISENRVVRCPNGIPVPLLPLLGCAVPTGMGIVLNTLRPQAGQSIAIWGAGGIGLSAVLGAVASGCSTIIVVDRVAEKLAWAKQLGATHGLMASEHTIDEIRALTGGHGVDYGVDAAGAIMTIESGYQSVRKGGGRFVVAGNPPAGQKIQIDPMDLISGRHICGSWGGESRIEDDVTRYATLVQQGQLPMEALVSHRMPFSHINDAMRLMASGATRRVILDHAA